MDSDLFDAVKNYAAVADNCLLVSITMGRKKDKSDFNAVLVEKSTTIKGGLMPKACPLPVSEVVIGNQAMEFVHVHKRCEWLCRMVTGEAPYNRPLGRVKLLDKLLHKVRKRWGEPEGGGSDSECDLNCKEPIDDPMASLAFEGEPVTVVANKKKKFRGSSNRNDKKDTIMRVRFPAEPPEKNPSCKEVYEVCLLLQNSTSVWLLTDHLPWAIAYMHDQWLLGGVDAIEDEEEPAESPLKSKTIKWDFQHDCWVATVVSDSTKTEKRLKPFDSEVRAAWRLSQGKETMVMEVENEGSALGYDVMKTEAYKILENWVREQI